MTPRGLITYDGLPVSAGGAHRLRGKDRSAAWARILGFLTSFTTYEKPDDVRLLLAEGPRIDHAFVSRAHRHATHAFGPAKRRLAIAGAVEEREHRWALTAGDVDECLELMQSLEPFPSHWRGAPLVLAIGAAFRLCDPDSGVVFPAQDPELYGRQEIGGLGLLGLSRIHLRLGTTSTCALFLSLPFTEATQVVRAYARRIDQSLPFRLSKAHWSRWQVNAGGTRFYRRRISVLDTD